MTRKPNYVKKEGGKEKRRKGEKEEGRKGGREKRREGEKEEGKKRRKGEKEAWDVERKENLETAMKANVN